MPSHILHSLLNCQLQSSIMKSKRGHRSVTALRAVSAFKTSAFPRQTPFDTLPLELKIAIFSFCAPQFPHLSDTNQAPLLLTRVCKSWRALVLSTPMLWSSFGVELVGSVPRTASLSARDVGILNNIKRWLQMSKSYSISVRIAHFPTGRSPDLRSAQFIGALIPEARRWRDVEFILPALSMSALQQSLPRDTPSLRSFTLQLNGAASTDAPFNLSRLNIPWHQLTTLNLRLEYDNLITLDKCLDILSQTRTLRRCSFDAFCILEKASAYSDGISLPTLEELHLNLHGRNGVEHPDAILANRPEAQFATFISIFDVPLLQSFRLEWLVKDMSEWSQAQPQLISFLEKAAQTLRTLNLEYVPLSEAELLQCLSSVPHITRLDLRFSLSNFEGDPITDAFFLKCTSPLKPRASCESPKSGTTACSFPRLEEVSIECHGGRHTPSILAAFIDSRLPNKTVRVRSECATLKSFHMLSMNQPLATLDKNVKKWCDDGLNISIDSLVVR